MSDLKIRPFQPDEGEAVVDLWQRCGLVVSWNDPYDDIARKQGVQPENFLVGELQGQIVAAAMAGYDGHRGWIFYLAVDPVHQRKGFGRQIVDACEVRLRAMGCPKINVQIRESNLDAARFYESIGFSQDAVVGMGKRLVPDE